MDALWRASVNLTVFLAMLFNVLFCDVQVFLAYKLETNRMTLVVIQFSNKKLSYRKQMARKQRIQSNISKFSGGGFTGEKAYGAPVVASAFFHGGYFSREGKTLLTPLVVATAEAAAANAAIASINFTWGISSRGIFYTGRKSFRHP